VLAERSLNFIVNQRRLIKVSWTLEHLKSWNNLKAKYESMNPFELKKELEKQLKWFFKITEVAYKEAA